MAAELSDRVRRIAEERGVSESEVFERALKRGLEDPWEDLVLARYLDGRLSPVISFSDSTVFVRVRPVDGPRRGQEWRRIRTGILEPIPQVCGHRLFRCEGAFGAHQRRL